MVFNIPVTPLVWVLGGMPLLVFIKDILRPPARVEAYLKHLWVYFLVFTVAELFTFAIAVWILAAVCFVALREYLSLVDVRFQDRWGLWGAYLHTYIYFSYYSIPCCSWWKGNRGNGLLGWCH